MLTTTPTPKTCHCGREFMPQRMGQRVCGPECAERHAVQKRVRLALRRQRLEDRIDRAITRKRKEALKTPTEWEQECRAIVQKIARLRDCNDGCISCHVGPNYGGVWHGSHFRPAGNNAAVQFHLWNIHKACEQCNFFKGGNLGPYRVRLVEKIGADRVEWLESQKQPVKTNVDYLKRFKAVMGKRLRRMEKRLK